MKTNFGNFLRIVTLVSLFVMALGPSTPVSEVLAHTEAAAAAFPVIADFETENVDTWFTYGDTGSSIVKSVTLTNTLSALGVTSNTVMLVDYVAAGWGVGVGKDLIPFQDWSGYDGFSFWFQGTNSGTEFKIILTDNDGERLATKFTDNFTGWQELRFPWQVFYWDPDFQPDWGHNDGPTLTAVEAFAFAPAAPNTGSYAMDRIALFKDTGVVVNDFETENVDAWFTYGDTGSSIAKSVTLTNTLSALGVTSNTVMLVDYVAAGWGVGVGQDLIPFQDWSDYDGFSFWFQGTNSGTEFKIILTDNDGERLATKFTDDFTGWQELRFPWQVFYWDPDFQPDWGHNDGPTLTAVEAFAFAPAAPSAGSYAMDRIALFKNVAGPIPVKVGLSAGTYAVTEGGSLTITVMLNMESETPVQVSYRVSDITATIGEDYTVEMETVLISPHTGQLYFAPGVTEQTFIIHTIDDTEKEPDETIALTLFDPVNAELGRAEAIVTIEDNEAICDGRTLMIDSFDNYSMTLPMEITDTYGNVIGFLTWSDGSPVAITTTQVITGDALARPGQAVTNTLLRMDSNIASWGGFTHNFENEAGDTWLTQDWSTYEGFGFWMYGTGSGVEVGIELQENRPANATVPGDGGPEIWSYIFKDDIAGWRFVEIPWDRFTRKEIGNGAPNDGLTLEEVHGWAFISLASGGEQTHYFDNAQVCGERVVEKELAIGFSANEYAVTEGETATLTVMMNITATETVSVEYVIQESGATPNRDYVPAEGTLTFAPGETAQSFTVATLDNSKYDGDKRVVFVLTNPTTGTLGYQRRGILLIEDDEPYDPALLEDFEYGVHHFAPTGGITLTLTDVEATDDLARPGQDAYETVLNVTYNILTETAHFPGRIQRLFGGSQNWSNYEGFRFWLNGHNTGNEIQVELLGEREPDPGPDGWELVWSDEFNEPAGTPPNPEYWTHEIGDGALNGITGWGNGEFQYYTNSTDNAATDGAGNLVITARKVDENADLICWYGPCEYTSARLISQHKIDFAYGRIEANVKVPAGQGLWPAFWMLGNDISEVDWPTSGEIDIMEYVGKDPNAVYGTLHGPGYSGGNGYGSGPFDLGEPVANDFHLFAIEWEPGVIRWYIDDTNFFTATEEALFELKPTAEKWIYDHPFFLLMNLAVGGNFPGNPDETTPFPAEMIIDYVRVYQAPNTSERFATTFTDNFTGWRQVSIPFSNFTRVLMPTTRLQEAQTSSDDFSLTEMWGYSFNLPVESSGEFYLDEIRVMNFTRIFLPLVMRNH